MNNLLIRGDNFDALAYLLQHYKEKIVLVYIDPPYGTRQDFTFSGDRFATISRMNGGKVAYKDTISGEEYLKFLSARVALMRDLMADHGSMYLHIDQKMGHYVKVLLDKIFGQKNFINDITRVKCNPKNFARRGYGNMKDMVLFYAKSYKKFVWNEPRESIEIDASDPRFRSVDRSGRRYTTTPLHAPGETKRGPTGKKWRGMMPPPGRHWRYNPVVLDELDRKGLIEWSSSGNPRKIIYAEDVVKAGIKVQDIWEFKDPQNPKYPTEKNLDMLKMIIKASSNEGDLVLDAFCGSGTTLVAAQTLNRAWIGIDKSPAAITICKSRLTRFQFLHLKESFIPHERLGEKNLRDSN